MWLQELGDSRDVWGLRRETEPANEPSHARDYTATAASIATSKAQYENAASGGFVVCSNWLYTGAYLLYGNVLVVVPNRITCFCWVRDHSYPNLRRMRSSNRGTDTLSASTGLRRCFCRTEGNCCGSAFFHALRLYLGRDRDLDR